MIPPELHVRISLDDARRIGGLALLQVQRERVHAGLDGKDVEEVTRGSMALLQRLHDAIQEARP